MIAEKESGIPDTGALLRRLAVGFADAGRSGRDDDLWAVQSAARRAWQDGIRHADLALLLVQLHLDCHAVAEAGVVLAASPRAAATPTGRMLRAGLLLQRGDPEGAGGVLGDQLRRVRTWRTLALLAAVYEDVVDRAAADLLYAEAGGELDAKQLPAWAWIECQRARLRLETGRIEGADRHLRRAEAAAPGCVVAAMRARWHDVAGKAATAAAVWGQVAEATDRPDHWQAAAAAAARAGLDEEAALWQQRARTGFVMARGRWPYRYAHHEVDWYLQVDRDTEQALAVAWSDYRQRPARRPAARLAAALRAAGDTATADRLDEEHERRRSKARAGLEATLHGTGAALPATA